MQRIWPCVGISCLPAAPATAKRSHPTVALSYPAADQVPPTYPSANPASKLLHNAAQLPPSCRPAALSQRPVAVEFRECYRAAALQQTAACPQLPPATAQMPPIHIPAAHELPSNNCQKPPCYR